MIESIDLSKYIRKINEKRFIKFTGKITKVTGSYHRINGPIATIGSFVIFILMTRMNLYLLKWWF